MANFYVQFTRLEITSLVHKCMTFEIHQILTFTPTPLYDFDTGIVLFQLLDFVFDADPSWALGAITDTNGVPADKIWNRGFPSQDPGNWLEPIKLIVTPL